MAIESSSFRSQQIYQKKETVFQFIFIARLPENLSDVVPTVGISLGPSYRQAIGDGKESTQHQSANLLHGFRGMLLQRKQTL